MRITATVAMAGFVLASCGASNEPSTVGPAGSSSSDAVVSSDVENEGAAAVGSAEPAHWELAFEPDVASSELHLLVQERACASGRSAEGRIVVDVESTADTITLTVSVRPLGGDQECPGNPNTPFVMVLPDRVGDRRIESPSSGLDNEFVSRTAVLTSDEPATIVEPASETDAAMQTWVEPRCDADPDDRDTEEFLPLYDISAEYRVESMVVGAAVENYGLSVTGWHVLRLATPAVGDASWWTQYRQGVPVAQVRVEPGLLGWTGHASVCADLPNDWSPDLQPGELDTFEPRQLAPRLDIDAWLDSVDGLRPDGDGWAFDDPAARCPVWAAIQSAAIEQGATITFTSWFGTWPDNVEADGGIVARQVEMGIASDGRGVLIATDGDRVEEHDIDQGLVWDDESNLLPCLLDKPLSYSVDDTAD